MAIDERLADRIRRVLAPRADVVERKMFGGLAFIIRGNMCCGVVGDMLMLRLGKDGAAEALTQPHAKPMDFTGKPVKSMIYVEAGGIAAPEDLRRWLKRAADFAETLPAK